MKFPSTPAMVRIVATRQAHELLPRLEKRACALSTTTLYDNENMTRAL